MQINDESADSKYILQSCSEKGIMISDKMYTTSILVNSNKLVSPWLISSIRDLREIHLLEIIKTKPKILIIGSGKQHFYLDSKLLFKLYANKIGCEVMQTNAACRTYNLLALDNRNVCGLLFPI
jgi:uncharacterized protein